MPLRKNKMAIEDKVVAPAKAKPRSWETTFAAQCSATKAPEIHWPTSQRLHLVACIVTLLLLTLVLHAQTTDPTKIAELQSRFKQGKELLDEGKFDDAQKIFDAILTEEPKARGSLFCSAYIYLHQGQYEKAAAQIDRFLALEPKDFKGLVLAIQANQSLKRSAKVESLRTALFSVRDKIVPVPGLTDTRLMYIRERLQTNDGRAIVFGEYFDYRLEPFWLYLAEQVDTAGAPIRRLVLSYDPEATKQLPKDAIAAGQEAFFLSEYVIVNGEVKQINIYRQESSRPDYLTCRQWMLDAIKSPPKPIVSAPMNGGVSASPKLGE